MGMISTLLFENLWALAALLVAVEALFVVIWSRQRTPAWARAVCVGFAMIPACLTLSILIETPRERVIAFCWELAGAVDEGEVKSIAEHFADDFQTDGFDRSAFVERLEQTLTRFRVDQPRLRDFEVAFPTDESAVVTLTATCRVRSIDAVFDHLPSRWRLTLRRDRDSWLVAKIESIPIPPLNLRNVRDWLR
ncbi:MAG: hypothetical protein V1790_19080 [Planctomycetota bacterium]